MTEILRTLWVLRMTKRAAIAFLFVILNEMKDFYPQSIQILLGFTPQDDNQVKNVPQDDHNLVMLSRRRSICFNQHRSFGTANVPQDDNKVKNAPQDDSLCHSERSEESISTNTDPSGFHPSG